MSEQFTLDESQGRNEFPNWVFIVLSTTIHPDEDYSQFVSEYREKEKENCGFYYEAMETSDAPT